MTKASILIVEDEAIVAADLANKLEQLGYAIRGATASGEEAVVLARTRRPDLVLMDIRLEGRMDGVEAAEQIRRECDLPVIYLTAHSDRATLERAKLTEPFGYILKPFEEPDLLAHIEMALYKHQAELKLRESEAALARANAELHVTIEELRTTNEELRTTNEELQVTSEELSTLTEQLQMNNEQLERRVADRTRELTLSNQMLRMISECNEALVRTSDERALIQEICRIINEVGGYRMVWVGFAEQDKRRTVRPVASVGFDEGYLDTIRITWADNKFGRGPTGTAIRTGKVCLGEDFLSDPKLAAWRKPAVQHGFRSSIALPLNAGGHAFGALTIYAPQPRAFDPTQVRQLSELADDLSFGITALRVQADRDHARRSLEERTTQLRALAAELAQAEQRERRRLAQVLHDDFQQLLVGARYRLECLQFESRAAGFARVTKEVDDLLSLCLKTSRSLTLELSPPILHQAGLAAALKWLGRWFRETHGLAVRVVADDQAGAEKEELRGVLFQAVRELLFNVVKHGRVQKARVRVSRLPDNQIKIVVSDRGAGFDPARLRAKQGMRGGFGLFSLRERLELLGGRLDVESAPGKGSRFILVAPLENDQNASRRSGDSLIPDKMSGESPVGPQE